MAKFRFHRGGLGKSMATMIEGDKSALVKAIVEVQPGKCTYRYVGWDERVSWDTYIILIDGLPIGYANERLGPEAI